MAEFLCVLRGGSMAKMKKDQVAEHMQTWGQYIETLSNAGQYKGGSALKDIGKMVKAPKDVSAEPSGRGKTRVTGYMILEARTIAQATKLAKSCPILEVGGNVEVRPCQVM